MQSNSVTLMIYIGGILPIRYIRNIVISADIYRHQWRTQKIFMGDFIQWQMVVIFIWCALFVTSQFDVIFMFSSEVC